MRAIPPSRSILSFWEELTFLEAALLADEETSALAAPVTAAVEEFMPTLQRELGTRRSVIQSNARTSVADARIDLGIRGLFSATLHLVGQNRKMPAFTALFTTHIGEVVRHALGRQVEIARDLLDKLSLPHYTPEFRAAQAAALEPLIARGAAVLEEQRAATLARAAGRLDVRAWKDEANAVRLSVYASLLAIAAQTGRNKAWAEAFFPSKNTAPADGADKDEPVDEGEAPAGA
jgi:hypothetical protein